MSPREALAIGKEAGLDFAKDKAANHAAALSYYTVFSLAPLLLVTVFVAGAVLGRERVQQELVAQFGGLIGQQGADLIATMMTNASEPRKGAVATIIGVAAIVVGATGAFAQLKAALNTVWEVRPAPAGGPWYRSLWRLVRTRLLSFAMVLVLGFLLLASLVVSTALAGLGAWASERLPLPGAVMQALNFVVSLGFITLLMALVFKFLPDARIGWREVWLGAVVTSFLFVVGKFAIGLYLGRSAVASVFGAAGSVVVVLLWIYYSAIILLMGAEITQTTARHLGKSILPAAGFVLSTEPGSAPRAKAA